MAEEAELRGAGVRGQIQEWGQLENHDLGGKRETDIIRRGTAEKRLKKGQERERDEEGEGGRGRGREVLVIMIVAERQPLR
jgi:hypothetical protein